MKLAMIGLGKMGASMSKRLLLDGHQIVAYDINTDPIQEAEKGVLLPPILWTMC
jgi:6-phosphogluconate dehydrogenase